MASGVSPTTGSGSSGHGAPASSSSSQKDSSGAGDSGHAKSGAGNGARPDTSSHSQGSSDQMNPSVGGKNTQASTPTGTTSTTGTPGTTNATRGTAPAVPSPSPQGDHYTPSAPAPNLLGPHVAPSVPHPQVAGTSPPSSPPPPIPGPSVPLGSSTNGGPVLTISDDGGSRLGGKPLGSSFEPLSQAEFSATGVAGNNPSYLDEHGHPDMFTPGSGLLGSFPGTGSSAGTTFDLYANDSGKDPFDPMLHSSGGPLPSQPSNLSYDLIAHNSAGQGRWDLHAYNASAGGPPLASVTGPNGQAFNVAPGSGSQTSTGSPFPLQESPSGDLHVNPAPGANLDFTSSNLGEGPQLSATFSGPAFPSTTTPLSPYLGPPPPPLPRKLKNN